MKKLFIQVGAGPAVILHMHVKILMSTQGSLADGLLGIFHPYIGPLSRPLLSGTPIRAFGSWTTLIASCRPLTFVTFEDILILEF